ncbi:MAG TPA: hypothetical protein VNW47_00750 [Terriglobales bacterium]|jgi:uncharacterized membrane protein|nr:hypothetical protein [Terriglobales bacterium]
MKLIQAGRYCFALALLAFGVQHFVYARYATGLGPPWIPGHTVRACLMGAVLVLAGLAIVTRKKDRCAAIVLGVVLLIFFLFAYLPRLVANVHDPGPWTSGAEILALSGVSWTLAGSLASGASLMTRLGRSLFALTLTVFGIQHLIYGQFVATLIPSWIPGRLFFAYAVGIAFIAATLSILSGIKARLAATLLGIMFLTWVFILHSPRVMAASTNGNEWTSLLVALAMSGGSWIVAATASN